MLSEALGIEGWEDPERERWGSNKAPLVPAPVLLNADNAIRLAKACWVLKETTDCWICGLRVGPSTWLVLMLGPPMLRPNITWLKAFSSEESWYWSYNVKIYIFRHVLQNRFFKTYESVRWQWIGGRHFHRLVKTRGSGWASGWWSSRLGPTFTNDRIKGRSFGHFDVLFVKILQERQRWPVFIVKMPIRFVLVGREGGSRGGWSCHFCVEFSKFSHSFFGRGSKFVEVSSLSGLARVSAESLHDRNQVEPRVENNSISSLLYYFYLFLERVICVCICSYKIILSSECLNNSRFPILSEF